MPISTLPATIECLQPIHNRREINVGGGFQKVVFPIKNDVLPAHGTHTFGLPLVARMLGLLLIEDISYFFLCCFTTSSPEILVGISSVFLFHFHLHLFFQLCRLLLKTFEGYRRTHFYPISHTRQKVFDRYSCQIHLEI